MGEAGINIASVIGIIMGAMILIVPAVKWFINDWAKKSEKLEKMKAARISKIEEESKEVRRVVNSLKDTISEHSKKLGSSEARMKQLNSKIDTTVISLDNYVKNIEDKVKQEVRSQILQLSKELQIIKGKRSTDG